MPDNSNILIFEELGDFRYSNFGLLQHLGIKDIDFLRGGYLYGS